MLEQVLNFFVGVLASATVALAGWILSRSHLKRKTGKPHPTLIDPGRQRGRSAIALGCIILLAFALWTELLGPRFSDYLLQTDIAVLVRKPRWIAYEPLGFNPSLSANPDINLIGKELGWIQQAGFDGVITFTSRGNFAEIPKLAKEKRLAVIMGIWDPTDRQEMAAAISQRHYVDAYCVGHDGWPYRYSYDALVTAINHVRFRTGRPVSTTQKIEYYLHDERFLFIGDWLFPDILLPIRDKNTYAYTADAKRDVTETIALANKLAGRASQSGGKPILLKMVGYPKQADIADTSNDEQAKFFIILADALRDVGTSLSTNVSVSMYSAFDITWKTGPPYYEWESYTGLLDSDGNPRPAVREIMVRRLP